MADERHDWFITQVFGHRATLYRYLTKFMSRAEDVEDVVQETFVRVYSLTDFRGVDSPKALLLLYRVGSNLAARATDSTAHLEPSGVDSSDTARHQQTQAQRRFESFCGAVERLPPLCRRVLVLRKAFKLSHAEISDVLNASHSTIEKHVAKGLMRCRDGMRELGLLETMNPKIKPGTVRRLRDGGDAE